MSSPCRRCLRIRGFVALCLALCLAIVVRPAPIDALAQAIPGGMGLALIFLGLLAPVAVTRALLRQSSVRSDSK